MAYKSLILPVILPNKNINLFKTDTITITICRGDSGFLQGILGGYSPLRGAKRVEIPWIWGADEVEIPFFMGEFSYHIEAKFHRYGRFESSLYKKKISREN